MKTKAPACMGMLACLMLAVIGCTPSTPEALRASLLNADAAWAQSAADKDAAAFVSFVADDGSLLPANSPILTEKNAMKEWASNLMTSPGYALHWEATTGVVSRTGDLGYTVGTYELTLNDADGNPMTDTGKYATVWEKEPDGKWKVAVDVFNSDLPPPVPEPMAQ